MTKVSVPNQISFLTQREPSVCHKYCVCYVCVCVCGWVRVCVCVHYISCLNHWGSGVSVSSQATICHHSVCTERVCVCLCVCLCVYMCVFVNGLYLYSTFLVFLTTLSTLQQKSAFTHSHTHIHTHTFTHQWGSNLGFSILPKDTSKCRPEEPGIKPPTFCLVADLLYLLSHINHHHEHVNMFHLLINVLIYL